jgi:hypothetical protein
MLAACVPAIDRAKADVAMASGMLNSCEDSINELVQS